MAIRTDGLRHRAPKQRGASKQITVGADHPQRHEAAIGFAGDINPTGIGDASLDQIRDQSFQERGVIWNVFWSAACFHKIIKFFAGQKKIPLLSQTIGKDGNKALLRRQRIKLGGLRDGSARAFRGMEHNDRVGRGPLTADGCLIMYVRALPLTAS